MKKHYALTLLLVPVLAACGGGAPAAPTTSSVSINSASQLEINAPTKATASAKDANGNTLNGKTVTWTSSDPAIVAVAADGTLTAKKLNITPVRITASIDGKTASTDVNTHGLEVTGGTLNDTINSKVGVAFLVRFRKADQTGPDTAAPVTIQGPSGFNGGQAFTGTTTSPLATNAAEVRYRTTAYTTATPVDGQYTASTVVNGKTFTDTFTVDADTVLPALQNPTFGLTATSYTLNGTAGTGVTHVQGAIFNTGTSQGNNFAVRPVDSLGVSASLSPALPAGTYEKVIRTSNFDFGQANQVSPEQFNVAITSAGMTTF